jgi:hypothetical protein
MSAMEMKEMYITVCMDWRSRKNGGYDNVEMYWHRSTSAFLRGNVRETVDIPSLPDIALPHNTHLRLSKYFCTQVFAI